jgi:hypothetical protein
MFNSRSGTTIITTAGSAATTIIIIIGSGAVTTITIIGDRRRVYSHGRRAGENTRIRDAATRLDASPAEGHSSSRGEDVLAAP